MGSLAPYLVEQCEDGGTPVCSDLARDPADVLADRGRWPDHMCTNVALELRVEWAADHAHRVAGTNSIGMIGGFAGERWIASGHHGPMGIGRASLPTSFPIRHLSADTRQDAARFAVFSGDETLFFPLVATIDFSTVEMFFLARREGVNPSEYQWRADGVRFRVLHEHGRPIDLPIDAVISNAREWWKGFGGRVLVRPGRPAHPARSFEEVERWLDQYFDSLAPGVKPTLEEFQNRYDYPARTWTRNTKAWGKTWSQLRNEAKTRRGN